MKLFRILMLSLAAVFFLGCPGDPIDPPPPPKQDNLYFSAYPSTPSPTISAATLGVGLQLTVRSDYARPPLSVKFFFSGPGTLTYNDIYTPSPPVQIFPGVLSSEYSGDRFSFSYRPPTNAEVPPEGTTATVAMEAFNPRTNKWERSPDYGWRVIHRNEPGEFYLMTSSGDMDRPYAATINAGEVFEFFLAISPLFYEGIQLQCDLLRPDDFYGELGELVINDRVSGAYACAYTAPEGIASPTDIIARFSYLDPWVKEIQEHELTITVVPKE